MVAPFGAGKTTVALQWAQSQQTEVQYISASAQPFSPESRLHPPDDFGTALRDLLNVCSRHEDDTSISEISSHLERVMALSQEEQRSFILDDLHHIRRPSVVILLELLETSEFQPRIDHGLFISRTIDASVLGKLRSVWPVRLVLPEALEFDPTESAAAHQIGIFGTATAEQVEAARIESGGWISGMLVSLHGYGGTTISPAAFRSSVLNDLLMDQRPPVLQIMLASANLPCIHREIWEGWFDHFNIPHNAIPSMISQLPLLQYAASKEGLALAPTMKAALRHLTRLSMSEESLNELLTIALNWYVNQEMFDFASQLAAEQELSTELLMALKSPCTKLAEVESWSEIHGILRHLPLDVLTQDPDLTYWYVHALVEKDQWAQSRSISERCLPDWLESANPVVRARAELLQSWNMNMLNHADAAVELSTSAYNTFPEHVHAQRMWAAGTASLANSLKGDWPEATRWSAVANFESTFTPHPSRWWHNNASPISYAWMCTQGLMNDAYSLAGQQIHSLSQSSSLLTTRYRLLQAQIEIERLNLDAAEELLNAASGSLDKFYSQDHHYRLVRANLARIKGEYHIAKDFLTNPKLPTRLRFDQYTREIFALASIALDESDIESADFLVNSVSPGDIARPKNFADPHPDLIRALLVFAQGNMDEAISLAQSVLQDAQERSHTYYVVRANAIMAHIYHHSGEPDLWHQSVRNAQEAAGNSGYQAAFLVRTEDVRKMREFTSSPPTHDVAQYNTCTRLSSREVEVLEMVSRSLSNKEIAAELFISISTVKNHLANIYDKLGTNRRGDAVKLARSRGLIS